MQFKKISAWMLMIMMIAALLTTAVFAEGSYEPTSVKIGIGGTGTFYIKDDGAEDSISDKSVTADGYGEFILTLNEPSVYKYEIYSNDTLNSARFTVIVTVEQVEEGDIQILRPNVSILPKGDDQKVQVAYYPIVMVDPPIKKIVEGDNAPTDVEFIFDFRAVDTSVESLRGNMPMPEGSDGQTKTVVIKGSGEVEIGSFIIEKAGTYIYEAVERDTKATGFTYDKGKYRIEYIVSEGATGYQVVRTITKDGGLVAGDKMVFTNKYSRPGSGGGTSTKTGDETGIIKYAAVSVLAITCLAATAWTIKRKAGTKQ